MRLNKIEFGKSAANKYAVNGHYDSYEDLADCALDCRVKHPESIWWVVDDEGIEAEGILLSQIRVGYSYVKSLPANFKIHGAFIYTIESSKVDCYKYDGDIYISNDDMMSILRGEM